MLLTRRNRIISQFFTARVSALPLSGRLAVLPTTRPVLTRPLPTPLPRQKPWLLPLLVVFVLVNLALMFFRSYHLRLDGDITPIVLPRADYAHILQDPFGWSVLRYQSIYAGTNRFFAHIAMRLYWRNVPLFLQAFMNPVASLYVAQAIFNTTVEALLLYVMGWYATGTRRLTSPKLWLAMALMIPFFQTTGYNRQMAIMDNAVTYNFYYPLPLLLLLVLLWPLYQAVSQRQPLRLSPLKLVSVLLLAVVLSFNGPIITGVVLVMLLGVGVYTASQRWRWPVAQWLRGLSWQAVLLWSWFGVLCLYSLYIGRNNSENLTTTTVSISERYHLMPTGIYNTLTARLGMPLLVLSCLANVWLVRRLLPPSAEGRRLGPTLRWVGLFAATYTLLLPLGGYRPYRPFILHHDCIVPITVALVIFYGLSTARLLMQLQGKAQRWYIGAAIIMVAIYINADRRLYKYGDRIREHHSLHLLAQANAPTVVRLPEECTLLSWDPIPDPVSSLTSAEMLRYWRVTNGLKLYYYLPPQQNLGPKLDE